MALIRDPSRLNRRIEFDSMQSYETPQGVSKEKLSPIFTVWGAVYNRTINQQYKLVGTKLEDTLTIIIRHNKQVNNQMVIKLDNQQYNIVDIKPDESEQPIAYDVLTLKEVTK
jgi:SPP1 family predicted phage head-tail adaptor